MEWVLSHMEDPGFNDPLEPPAAAPQAAPAAAAAAPSADPESVAMLQAMGFTDQQARLCRTSLQMYRCTISSS